MCAALCSAAAAAVLLQIPYFNAPIFLENKTQIGKVEEILGSINNVVSCSSSRLQVCQLGGLAIDLAAVASW